jgi:peptide subunit release factor 1 (eRF1)
MGMAFAVYFIKGLLTRSSDSLAVMVMILHSDIERLAKLKSDHGILTAYIPMDPRLRFVRQQAVSQFKGALKAAQERLRGTRWQDALDRESDQVLNFLSSSEPAGRGLVLFSCRPAALWEVLELEFLVPNFVDIDTTTKTGILAQTLAELTRFVVVVLQKDKARIYLAEQGTAGQQSQIATAAYGEHNEGAWSRMRYQQHMDFHVAEHLKKVADELKRLAEAQPFKLAFGGTEETANQMLKTLPDPIAKTVIGRFPVDYKHDTEHEILQRAQVVWENQEHLEEEKLVDRLFDAANSGTQGVLGIEPTLNALAEEKVRTLLIVDGLAIDGSVCVRCNYFSAKRFKACPLCGGNAEQREVLDRAVEKAILTGAELEVVARGEARDRLLAEGGIGAVLRY